MKQKMILAILTAICAIGQMSLISAKAKEVVMKDTIGNLIVYYYDDGTVSVYSPSVYFTGNSVEIPRYLDGNLVSDVRFYSESIDYTWNGCDEFHIDDDISEFYIDSELATISEVRTLLIQHGIFVYVEDLPDYVPPDDSGNKCGENAEFTLDEDGTLTINGTGDINRTFTEYQNEITSVVVGEGITSLCYGQFQFCSNMESIVLPDTLNVINSCAFESCTSLKEITLPVSCKFHLDAFTHCTALENIYCSPDSQAFTSIDGILYNKDGTILYFYPEGKKAKEYVMPETVTTIYSALGGDAAIERIVLSDNLSEADFAFSYLTSLKEIVVSDANENYCTVDGVLYDKDMTKLKVYPPQKTGEEFRVPDTIVSIETDAFWGNTNLKKVVLGKNTTEIGASAFKNCTNLTQVVCQCKLESVGGSAFHNTKFFNAQHGLKYIQNVLIGCDENLIEATVKDGTTVISSDALRISNYDYENMALKKVVFPDSVKEFPSSLFHDCPNLEEIVFPNCNFICGGCFNDEGDWLFDNCPIENLKTLTIGGNIASVNFKLKANAEDITIRGEKGSAAEAYAKENNYRFETLDTQREIVTYGKKSYTAYVLDNQGTLFLQCTDDDFLTTRNDGSYIGTEMEKIEDILTEEELSSVKNIIIKGNFYYLSIPESESIKTVQIVDNKSFDEGKKTFSAIFLNCNGVEQLQLPETMTFLPKTSYLPNLKSFTIPQKVTAIEYEQFWDDTALKSVTIHENVTEIGEGAFINCNSLKKVYIPPSVEAIGNCAFGYQYSQSGLRRVKTYSEQYLTKQEDFVIYGISGTAAQTYAEENDFPFIDVSGTGDMNSDCEVTVADVVLLQRYLHGLVRISKAQFDSCDINQDGLVNVCDLALLKRKLIYG
ncbi:MAG TPA: hypothetical protein DCO72_08190 [Ruminococcus sp.]|nr:hypothetical protein [Ruminococcus sp.]